MVVEPDRLGVARVEVAGLPVVGAVLRRIGLQDLVAGYLPLPDAPRRREVAEVLDVVVRALVLGRRPLYALERWAARFDPALLGIGPGSPPTINDDRVGRALDTLYRADRASLTTAVSLAAINSFGIRLDELHNDSTSISLYGAYRRSDAVGGGDSPRLRAARGHSKDHRPDLNQLVWILTTSADGSVPITYRLADGCTEDSSTHIRTWESCRAIAGRSDFLYVADCKLATRDNMAHIAGGRGRFLTVLPRSRKEDGAGRAWLAAGHHDWKEVARRPGPTKAAPPDIWWALPAPVRSDEGYRIVWIASSSKIEHDAGVRASCIARAVAALEQLSAGIGRRWSRMRTAEALADAAAAAIAKARAAPWVKASVGEEILVERRQVGRGRPGPDTAYREVNRSILSLTWELDQARIDADAASDGCFPLITNDEAMTEAELLAAYKAQPHLERRHDLLKGVLEAAPVELKSETRIDALGFCLYVALLVHTLIERELRAAMAAAGIRQLPLYHEHRACRAPTAARVLEVLEPLARTNITHRGTVLTTVPPTLDPLQRHLVELLGVPADTYGQNFKTDPHNSRFDAGPRCGT